LNVQANKGDDPDRAAEGFVASTRDSERERGKGRMDAGVRLWPKLEAERIGAKLERRFGAHKDWRRLRAGF
jgi:hypothetical protein